jgi:hypothetical protein
MSMIQNLFKSFLSKDSYGGMERESRSWMVQCPHCKYERSVWEMGGIRWGAAGRPSTYKLCVSCRQLGWHTIQKRS